MTERNGGFTTLDMTKDRDEIVTRTELLGRALVGCRQVCPCRVVLAAATEAEQLPVVEKLAQAVEHEGAAGGWEALKTALGDTVTKLQGMVFDQMAATPHDPEYLRAKDAGGREAAEQSHQVVVTPRRDPIEELLEELGLPPGSVKVVRF